MSTIDLSTQIAGIKLDSYLMNASGPKCTTWDELEVIGKSASTAIVTKSCTMEFREGNPEPRYSDLPLGSIQSMGLPNLGYKAYLEMVPQLKALGKPVVVSISGFSIEDNIEMVSAFQNSDVDLMIVAESSLPRFKRSRELYRLFRPYPFGMDLVVYTPEEIEKGKKSPISFVSRVMREGKTVYVRGN